MIRVNSVMDCCGCSACVEICPQKCISFKVDSEGFWYPEVDSTNCIDCGLCEKTCPVINTEKERVPLVVYAAKNKCNTIRQESSSGGIFTIVAERVINSGGVVFGVKFDKEWNVVFDYTETNDGLKDFRKSKYVQAWVGDSYIQAQHFLRQGRLVLFTGTPCQIAGLRRFLHRDYDNLLLMDLICEGVPSPKIWKRYLGEELAIHEKKLSNSNENTVIIKDISFRNKDAGWKQFSFAINFAITSDDGMYSEYSYVNRDSAYMRALFKCLFLRPICYNCPFKSCKSWSDITIADYWGIYDLHPEMDDDLGTSMIHVHTSKGTNFLDLTQLYYIETSYDEAFKYNNIEKSSPSNLQRDYFFRHVGRRKSIIKLMYELSIPHYYLRIYTKKFLGGRIVKMIRCLKNLNH